MQYRDEHGNWWTECYAHDGSTYYLNGQETSWELPASAIPYDSSNVVLVEASDDAVRSGAVEGSDLAASWVRVVDDSTQEAYYYNTLTQESKWELGPEDGGASSFDVELEGVYTSSLTADTEGSAAGCQHQVQVRAEQEEIDWEKEVLSDFEVPRQVSLFAGREGSAQIWPTTVGGEPSRLIRWNVLRAADPYRENFVAGDHWSLEHAEFEPKACFYAFESAVEHVERYWVEEAEAPFRARLQKPQLRNSRDSTKWQKRMPSQAGAAGRGGAAGMGGVDEFFAFPVIVHSSHAHHVDWTSGPDRYQISTLPEPDWGWTRLFSFYAYAASKYHVLETQNPLSQKVVKGHFLAPERGWKCVLAFYAFDFDIPGSNRYYVEEKSEPYVRTRFGMEPSSRWEPRHTFAAFDVPVPGSCLLDVHYTIRSADSLNPYPEQYRITPKDPWGIWERKLRFYAFPALEVLLNKSSFAD